MMRIQNIKEVKRFEVVGKVVAKGRPRFNKRGFAYTPTKTRVYERLVKTNAMKHFKKPLDTPLRVNIVIHKLPPKSWSKIKTERAINGEIQPAVKPDIDNYAKSILDGCDNVVFKDDNQIIELNIKKIYSTEDKAVITISEIETKRS